MKRFYTADEIIQLIDKYHAEMLTLSTKADELDHLADQLRDTSEASRIEGLRQQSERCRKLVRWRETRLETLGGRLAEIQTPQLAGIDNGDDSIPSV